MRRWTRNEFLAAGLALVLFGRADARKPPQGVKILLVVAHPDDEYAFAAATYRVAQELGGTVDQVIVTNGRSGFRYSQLAEHIYHASLAQPVESGKDVGRTRLPEIRRRETLEAGRILGIRHHYFLDQDDAGFTLDQNEPLRSWNVRGVNAYLTSLLERERYDFVFTLLPLSGEHGHHKAATLLALRAVEGLPADARPVVLGAEPGNAGEPLPDLSGMEAHPETSLEPDAAVFRFDRNAKFGFRQSLSYQIVVNWVIAAHKSQGLFQTDCNKHDEERYWIFASGAAGSPERTRSSLERTRSLFAALNGSAGEEGKLLSKGMLK